jgi:predicted Zn-dependent protease
MLRIYLILLGLLILLTGCAGLQIEGIEGLDILSSSAGAVSKAARPISDKEEYYVGRSVAARILSTYEIYRDRELTEYINEIGQTVALHSDKPSTYAGYHFAILDSKEINAFASPGGTIFITRGMIKAVNSEDELAAVLAHEVAHINHRDGIASIKKARWTEAVTIIGASAAKEYGSKDLSQLVTLFEGSIDDIVKTLVVNGYGREQEYSADKSSLAILKLSGYDPAALKDFVTRLIKKGKTSKGGMLQTHPATNDRLENIKAHIPSGEADISFMAKRTRRFKEAIR